MGEVTSTEGLARRVARRVLAGLGLLEASRRWRQRARLELYTLRQNRLSAEEVERIYRLEYHEKAGYGATVAGPESGWAPDDVLKEAHATAILEVWPLRKVLLGGCSSGMAVLVFQRKGVEAWGFDISPDLDRIVLPEVRPYVRRGSMTAIPFDAADAFDALITTDVLEHVQLKHIDRMLAECRRLGVARMVHLINHTRMSPDHMTLKPLRWWERKMAPHGFIRRKDLRTRSWNDPRIYGLNDDPNQIYTFWERAR
jgi:cyclopropane fatty-acyl-phospholipid synthase-like methyltransferase